ncbi:MAG: type II toxin-antitoxin system RelE/ParE family toxin [Chitinophagaceae bacterium]|jgi:proteic killer suppression protein
MIINFADKRTATIWDGFREPSLPIEIQETARRKLRMINNAFSLNDLSVPPSNHLEKLRGNLAGCYSIRINRQWRIVFEWVGRDAANVHIIDYHT